MGVRVGGNQPVSNYNASTRTKVAVLAGTALSTGLCVGAMLKRKNISSLKNLEMGILDGIDLCVASTVGGYVAGSIADPENKKYKTKDAVNQLIGNTLIPFSCLAIANKCTKGISKVAQSLVAVATLIGTTFLGHAVANKVNEKVFKEESGYKCSIKDFATDFDDVFFATSTVMKTKGLYQLTASLCPLTYMAHGYLAGTRQKDEKRLDKYV